MVAKFVAHGRKVQGHAQRHGWLPGARYTNLRDVRDVPFDGRGFLDINWKCYSYSLHLEAAKRMKPVLTIAQDVLCITKLKQILNEADELQNHSDFVAIVPKDPRLTLKLDLLIPSHFLIGYSVPTKYGSTEIPTSAVNRPVHLLGGRPDVQRRIANECPVVSIDCNRFTLDASFGDYFDGVTFRPHPVGGYENCLDDSMANINKIWESYTPVCHPLGEVK
jgi:hypothetical protein